MFTGIVTDMGHILDISKIDNETSTAITIATHYDINTVEIGSSISCAGACLTVISKGKLDDGTNWFTVNASPETLSVTTLQYWQNGIMMNLERALKVGDELGGHMVLGHVDDIGRVIDVQQQEDCYNIIISPTNKDLMRFIAPKGSICIDGTSLTVNTVDNDQFHLMIIPHTWENTTFQYMQAKMVVNIEIDVLARYVINAQQQNS